MKKIEFLKQGLENFCNHREPLEIDFTKGSITMITGPNGIGKTSIFQAIPFTLYGQCEKGRGDDVLNNKTGKNCHTWTIFTINDVQYRVDRFVKYTRMGNSVTITKGDDTKPYLKGHKEVVPEIEKLLMPYKLFMNTLLFSQKVKSFFTDLGDADQKEIFRKIMTLDDFVLYMKQCGLDLKEIEAMIMELNQTIAVNEGLLDSNTKQLELLNEKKVEFLKYWKGQIKEIKNKISLNDQTILKHLSNQKDLPEDTTIKSQEISNKISVLTHKLDNFSSVNQEKEVSLNQQASLKISELEKKSLELSNENAEIMRKELNIYKEKFFGEKAKCQEQLDIISQKLQDQNIESANFNSSMTYLEREIEDLELDTELTHCPTCKRDMNDDCIKHLKSIINEKETEAIEIHNLRNELAEKHKDLELKQTNWNMILQKEEKKYVELCQVTQHDNSESIKQFDERKNIAIKKVNAMIINAKIKIQKENTKERDQLQLDISNLNHDLDVLSELQDQINVYNNTQKQLQETKESYQNSLKTTEEVEWDNSLIENCELKLKENLDIINRTLDERSQYDDRIKMITFWKTGFSASGIQSMLIDEAIPFMNERISYYMDKLCNGRYKVTFDTLKATKGNKEFRDKISVEVFDTETHSDARVQFSGGQTRLVDIGTILTLADLQSNVQDVSVNIILFDEIFDALDSENIRHAANLLRLTAQDKWVGIISHNKIDDIEADDLLEFR